MDKKTYAKSHRDLIVYQKARVLAQDIFEMTNYFQKRKRIRSLIKFVVLPVQWELKLLRLGAKRLYEKHFISKLTDADGEQHETQHWIETAKDCNYISPEKSELLVERCREVGRLLGSMMTRHPYFAIHQLVLFENHKQSILVQEQQAAY